MRKLRFGAVQVKSTQTVALVLLAWATGCTPAKERPAGSAAGTPPSARAPSPAPAVSVIAASPTAASAPPAAPSSPAAASAAPEPNTGSAYVGCGQPIPVARFWDETSEAQALEAISAAKACAAQQGRRLLLEFVAPWCDDCQEMAKLDETAVVSETLRRRFERVRINVGKWDRHEALRESFGVHALATYIVIDPKTSRQLAKTTLEPITRKGTRLSAEQWAAWLGRY